MLVPIPDSIVKEFDIMRATTDFRNAQSYITEILITYALREISKLKKDMENGGHLDKTHEINLNVRIDMLKRFRRINRDLNKVKY